MLLDYLAANSIKRCLEAQTGVDADDHQIQQIRKRRLHTPRSDFRWRREMIGIRTENGENRQDGD